MRHCDRFPLMNWSFMHALKRLFRQKCLFSVYCIKRPFKHWQLSLLYYLLFLRKWFNSNVHTQNLLLRLLAFFLSRTGNCFTNQMMIIDDFNSFFRTLYKQCCKLSFAAVFNFLLVEHEKEKKKLTWIQSFRISIQQKNSNIVWMSLAMREIFPINFRHKVDSPIDLLSTFRINSKNKKFLHRSWD